MSVMLASLTTRPHPRAADAALFHDPHIVAAYHARPPYPRRALTLLASLITSEPRDVLELGAGSGDLTFRLARYVAHIDAVEPSEPMLAAASARAPEELVNIAWFRTTAETFVPPRRYALAVAAESLPWMDWDKVLPKLADCLVPGGMLAIVGPRAFMDLPWEAELRELLARFSVDHDDEPHDVTHELRARGLFREVGSEQTVTCPFTQLLHDYVLSFHARRGFSPDRMSPETVRAFDRELERLVLSYRNDGLVQGCIGTRVVWGLPGRR